MPVPWGRHIRYQDTSTLEHAYWQPLSEIHEVIILRVTPEGLLNITSCISDKALIGMLYLIRIASISCNNLYSLALAIAILNL